MSERRSHPWIDPGAVFVLAIGLRLAYVRDIEIAGLGSFLRLDPLYYHEWGARIARGEWVGAQPFEMSPLYPYLLGAVYRIFGEGLLAPKIAQAFLGALTCALVTVLARRLSGRAAGLVAGLLLATYGPALFYDGQINKTTLAMFLSALLASALVVSEGRRKGWIAFAGLVLGLAALVHENVNLAAPLVVAWLIFPVGIVPWNERGARALIFAAGWAVAVAPATAHNLAATGEVVLITTGGGENFYTGNHEGASGRYSPPPFVRPDPFFEHEDFRAEAARRLGRPVTRSDSSRFWWDEGARYLSSHPGAAIPLLWDKLSVFWNAFERPDNFFYENFRRFSPTLSLPLAGFGLMAPLALVGMALAARRFREMFPLYAVVAAFLLSAVIFFTQSRYRMPAVPLLTVFAAQAIVTLVDLARRREGRAAAVSGVALAGAFLFVNRDPGNNAAFWAQNDAILGEMYANAGRLDDA
ncbi:MAG: glycosyltransferase family 39 protein, partial [Acidobacteria bacterium]|nr:glycosyltransferase family 39 protein [Acidobacteriota bacterium]